jgi:hypothetical protein
MDPRKEGINGFGCWRSDGSRLLRHVVDSVAIDAVVVTLVCVCVSVWLSLL